MGPGGGGRARGPAEPPALRAASDAGGRRSRPGQGSRLPARPGSAALWTPSPPRVTVGRARWILMPPAARSRRRVSGRTACAGGRRPRARGARPPIPALPSRRLSPHLHAGRRHDGGCQRLLAVSGVACGQLLPACPEPRPRAPGRVCAPSGPARAAAGRRSRSSAGGSLPPGKAGRAHGLSSQQVRRGSLSAPDLVLVCLLFRCAPD